MIASIDAQREPLVLKWFCRGQTQQQKNYRQVFI
jgi:hypothetical protein